MRRISKNFNEGKIILNFDKKFALIRLSLYKKIGIPYMILNINYFNKHWHHTKKILHKVKTTNATI